MNEKKSIELPDLDWEDRERVLRLMFSKMNSGQPASNWRLAGSTSRGNEGRTSDGVGSKRTGGNTAALNKSFREDEEEYDQEVEDGGENVSNTNIFRKTNAEDYGGSLVSTKKGSQNWER